METPVVRLSDDDDEDNETVYEPAEDSFLLIDALEADLRRLELAKPRMCLEIGSGSGVVITALALAASNRWASYFLAVDLNAAACRATRRTSRENATSVEVARMDLTSALRARNAFDIVVFNPPYVVTESLEVTDPRMIARTWAGGLRGREVMDRIFAHIPDLLSDTGLFYLVVVRENDPREIVTIFESLDMTGEIAIERKVRGEHLHVLRFAKKKKQINRSLRDT